MAKLAILPGSTDVTVYVFILDSTSATGAGKTGLAYNTSGLVCYYVRDRAAAAQLTLATQTVTGAHSDGGFVEVDATNLPGVYRLDLSDAIVAASSRAAVVMLQGASGAAPLVLEVDLNPDLLDADDVLDEAVEGSVTLRQIQRLLLATLAGKVSGGGTTSIKYRDQGDTKDRITLTVDANGNRSATAVDVS